MIKDWAEDTPPWFQGVSRVAQSRASLPLFGSLGGVLVLNSESVRLGAVGVAGEAGPMDEQLATLGIGATPFRADAG